jgi:putative lipase involved disintegration of autophagic bodies
VLYFLVFCVLFGFMARRIFPDVPKGSVRVSDRVDDVRSSRVQIFSHLEAKSILIRHLLLDMCPSVVYDVTLWFGSCLLWPWCFSVRGQLALVYLLFSL